MNYEFNNKKDFINTIFDSVMAVVVFICLMCIALDFFRGACKGLEISELWAWIPLIGVSKLCRVFSIWMCR